MVEIRQHATSAVPPATLADVRRLLDEAFEGSFSEEDWEHALGGRHVLVVDGDVIVAHAAVVPRDLDVGGRVLRTGYVEAVATAPARQGTGLGSMAIAAVTDAVRSGYELGALSTGIHEIYARFGWERWRGPTFARQGGMPMRTLEEDDGLMVLRFGQSARLDLTLPITCEGRSGDDW